MKNLLFAVAVLLMGTGANAHEVKFTMPASIIVVNSDFILNPGKSTETVIRAPWMMANVNIENNSKHAVRVDHLDVKCTSGFNSYYRRVTLDQTIEAGRLEQVSDFIDALPASENLQYECIAVLQWTGPHHSHLESFRFISE